MKLDKRIDYGFYFEILKDAYLESEVSVENATNNKNLLNEVGAIFGKLKGSVKSVLTHAGYINRELAPPQQEQKEPIYKTAWLDIPPDDIPEELFTGHGNKPEDLNETFN
jgi:hypothetical protein